MPSRRAVGDEDAVRAGATGVDDPLGDAFVVEVADLLPQVVVLQQRRPAATRFEGMVGVPQTDAREPWSGKRPAAQRPAGTSVAAPVGVRVSGPCWSALGVGVPGGRRLGQRRRPHARDARHGRLGRLDTAFSIFRTPSDTPTWTGDLGRVAAPGWSPRPTTTQPVVDGRSSRIHEGVHGRRAPNRQPETTTAPFGTTLNASCWRPGWVSGAVVEGPERCVPQLLTRGFPLVRDAAPPSPNRCSDADRYTRRRRLMRVTLIGVFVRASGCVGVGRRCRRRGPG